MDALSSPDPAGLLLLPATQALTSWHHECLYDPLLPELFTKAVPKWAHTLPSPLSPQALL